MKDMEYYKYNQNPSVGTLEMEVSDFMRDAMMKEMGFEIEMLRGEYRPLPNGMHYYKIEVPAEKEEIIKLFFQFLVAHPNTDGSVKVMSYPINNN